MTTDNSNTLDLRRLWREAKKTWWAFLAGFILFLGLGITYVQVHMPKYNSYALVMIEDNSGAGSMISGALGGMAGLLNIGGSTSAGNELFLMHSNSVMVNTIKELKLNRTYIENDGLYRTLLYGTSPLEVEAPEEFFDTLTTAFTLKVSLKEDKADIDIVKGGRFLKRTLAKIRNKQLPSVINTPFGPLFLDTTAYFTPQPKERKYSIIVNGNLGMAEALFEDLTIEPADNMSDAIAYMFEGPDKQRNHDIINTLIAEYVVKRLNRKHEAAAEEVEFYDGRLAELFAQLSATEKEIEQYKKDNNIVAVEAEAEILAQSRVENQLQIAALQAQLVFYDQVLSTLENDPDGLAIIPGSSTASVPANPLIEQYNTLVLEKRNMETSAKPDNIALKRSKELISDMRTSLIQNARLMKEEAQINLKALYGLDEKAGSRLSQMPEYERKYITMFRDQTIMSELYAYLLSQRESSALNLHTEISPAFVIDEAYSDIKPSRIKDIIVIAVCLLLAIFVPLAFVMFKMKRRDPMENAFDLAPLHLDDHTVEYDGEQSQLSRLRMLMTKDTEARIIYVADFNCEDVSSRISDSFNRAGLDTRIVNLKEQNIYTADNDTLANPAFLASLRSEIEPGADRYVIVDVPDTNRLRELASVLDEKDTSLLIVIKSGSSKIEELRSLLRGLAANNIYVCLVK